MPMFSIQKKGLLAALAVLSLVGTSGVVSAQEDLDSSVLTKLGSALTFYGFLRIDAVYESDPLNDTQVPAFAISDDVVNSGGSDFTLYTRLTRFGLDFDGGDVLDGGDLTGKLELDFYGFDSSDSRNELRIRHAYLQIEKDDWSLLAGQTWDLFSPLYPSVNADTLNWNMGNPGDRRPQVRFGFTPDMGEEGELKLFGAIALQGAIDSQEIDGTAGGVLDGEASGIPQFQARAAYAGRLFGSQESEIGIWGVLGFEESDVPVGGEDEWTSSAFGIDFAIPITEEWKVKGEVWMGENMDDLRGGIGQGINATTGDEIGADGFWVELNYAYSRTTHLFAGVSVDDPDDHDLPTLGRDRNKAIYIGAHYSVWNPIRLGWEFTHLNTEYLGQADGDASRARVWIAYHF